VTNVQRDNVKVTVRMRTGVGPYRRNQLVETDPETAAGWMSANLADLMPLPAPALGELVAAAGSTAEGATDGEAARVDGTDKPRRRKAPRDAVVNGVHDLHDAAGTKPVEGADTGRSGDPAS
jgi:hypothetical protein